MNEKRVVCILAGGVELVSFLGLHFSHTLPGRLASCALMVGGGVIAIQALPPGILKKIKNVPIALGIRKATSSIFVKQEPPPPWPEFADALKNGFPLKEPSRHIAAEGKSVSSDGVLKPLSREQPSKQPASLEIPTASTQPSGISQRKKEKEVALESRFLVSCEDDLKIAGLKIRSAFIYIGASSDNPYSIDPALDIDFSKKNPGRPFDSARSYGYAELSPEERGDLLLWLSTEGRSDEASQSSIGFFLGGLAFCLLQDKAKLPSDALREIESRLREMALSPGIDISGFSLRISRLLVAIFARETHALYESADALPPTLDEMILNPEILRFRLGTILRKQFLLGGAWALAWVRTSRSFTLKTPAVRCPRLFDELFVAEVDAYEAERRFELVASSDSIGIHISGDDLQRSPLFIQINNTPDVTNLSSAQSALQDICDKVSDSLSEYSRAIASLTEGELSIEALHKLPANISREKFLTPFVLKTTANMITAKAFEANWVYTQLGVKQRSGKAGIGTESLELLRRSFAANGFGIVPGSISGVPTPLIDGCFVIFKNSNNAHLVNDVIVNSILHAMFIAVGQVDSSFVIQNMKALEADAGIFGPEIIQVSEFAALLMWTCSNIHNLSSRVSSLKLLNADDREKAAELVAKIVLVLVRDEQKTGNSLSTLYSGLGLSTDLVYHHMMPGRAAAGGFALDPEAVKRLAEESTKASALLSASLDKTQQEDATKSPEHVVTQEVRVDVPAIAEQAHSNGGASPDTSAVPAESSANNHIITANAVDEDEDEDELLLPSTFKAATNSTEVSGWEDESLWAADESDDIPQPEGAAYPLAGSLHEFARYLLTASTWQLAVLQARFPSEDFDLDDALSTLDELCFAQFADSLYLELTDTTVELDLVIAEQFAALYLLNSIKTDTVDSRTEQTEDVAHEPLSHRTEKPPVAGPKLSPSVISFLRVLKESARAEWKKNELDALAGKWGLMTMGVLEHLNETCFDTFSQELVDDMTIDEVVFDLSVLSSLIEIAVSTSEKSA